MFLSTHFLLYSQLGAPPHSDGPELWECHPDTSFLECTRSPQMLARMIPHGPVQGCDVLNCRALGVIQDKVSFQCFFVHIWLLFGAITGKHLPSRYIDVAALADTTKSDFPPIMLGGKACPCPRSLVHTKRVPIRKIHPAPTLLPHSVQLAHAHDRTSGRCLPEPVALSEDSSLGSESGLGQLVSIPCGCRSMCLLCGCLPIGRGSNRRPREWARAALSVLMLLVIYCHTACMLLSGRINPIFFELFIRTFSAHRRRRRDLLMIVCQMRMLTVGITAWNRLGTAEFKKGMLLTRCIAILLIRMFYTSHFLL
jgi:hypothetical protein